MTEDNKELKPQDILDVVLNMPEDKVMPWEDVVLPSRGLYYDGAVPDGRVKVRPMGLAADKILATQRLAQSGKSIDWLFRKCVQFPDSKFDPLSLLAGDRIFLLYYLRGITHGNMYEFVVKCTNAECEQSSTHEYDLNLLSSTITNPETSLGTEPFKVVLPHMSKVAGSDFWVKVRFMRGYDMQSMLNQRKMVRKVQGKAIEAIDDTIEDNLNMLIVEAMGSEDRMKIKGLISRLHASDTAAIREFLRKNSPGIDTITTAQCPNCSNEMKMELPITESFFRPTSSRST
jgi:hypothetical protein